MIAANFEQFLPRLAQFEVLFILIDGGAAVAQGLARATYDVDVIYSRDTENLQRLSAALKDLNPYYRGAPPGLPFILDPPTLLAGLNFTLTSDWGDIDLLGEVAGNGTYETLCRHTDQIELYGHQIHVVTLPKLIELKRAAGRPKDFETIAELEALQEERRLGCKDQL